MSSIRFPLRPVTLAATLALHALSTSAQTTPTAASGTLSTVTVEASADASAEGLTKPYAGGQVARGGRVGILGTQDIMSTPFSTTSYTSELIQNQQARSVADVLQNDPTVRVARGFGNFQESYFIRGFIVNSDDIAYNGLYGLLPRQYISSELFERVEVLRGASAFLNGATPSGGGIGGNINLLPKRAGNDPLTQVSAGVSSGEQGYVSTDIARRFGPDQSTGIRLNALHREGGTAVDDEKVKLDLFSLGLDWRSRDARISVDVGHQEHRLTRPRPNVTLGPALTSVPSAPDNSVNYAQPWTYSNERDTFGSVRGEYDINPDVTIWGAAGARRSFEGNRLAGITVTTAAGAGNMSRFDNERQDDTRTAELGMRAKLTMGSVKHSLVASYSFYELKEKNAYEWDFFNPTVSSMYTPVGIALPGFTAGAFRGNDLNDPALLTKVRLSSFAVGDTLSLLDDRALLTLGLRHQTLSSTGYEYFTGVPSGYEKSRVSPMAGFVYKLQPQVSLYANYIEGLSKGETAPTTSTSGPVFNPGAQLSPYVSKQKEVGVKYDGGSIGGAIAFFSTDKPRAFINDQRYFVEAGKDRHQGFELTTFGEAAKGLRVLGGLTLLDAKQKSTGATITDGKRVIGVPKVQGSIGVDWDVPGMRGLSFDARVVATGHSYADSANTLRVPGWARLDLGARYVTEWSGKLVTLRARVDNVADRNYWSSVGGYPENGYLVLGNPRTFSVSASVEF
ncbi:TonB-dependent receptor [Variovorax arabinosiphilus]|uniref:TonB-dependent receptor n=1 Tax=Variovorax arabinosiphilus TaxID=3053498 RepID=UPI0025778B46|nr:MULTISPECIES: TonB-dependent receptor [unclassified Variovorax]MDM0122020.1 TonB-dependent receptor [Variovorax sp. J2L1-78]MDM0131450.1 TonB-dependent receptor [Variovorax sp. J2L1-63]MDM0234783.1 TonB-dependent receptor [Variovorax sp. J2R1-6]